MEGSARVPEDDPPPASRAPRVARGGALEALVLAGTWPPSLNAQAIQSQRLLAKLPWKGFAVVPPYRAVPAGPAVDGVALRMSLELRRSWPPWNLGPALGLLGRLGIVHTTPSDRWLPHALPLAWAAARLPFRPELLLTIHYPPLGNVAGLLIRRRRWRHVPWIVASFDPWADMPDHLGDTARQSPAVRRLHEHLERRVFEEADGATFPHEELAEHYLSRHPSLRAKPVEILPMAFDAAAYPATAVRAGGERCLVRHLGWFYGSWRSPLPLLDGLELLSERNPEAARALRIELIGHWNRAEDHRGPARRRMERLGNCVMRGPVPVAEALASMSECDALLHIGARGARIFQPSKLVDYIGAGRPIVALCSPAPAERRIAAEAGALVADVDDPGAVATVLATLVARHREGMLQTPPAKLRHRHEVTQVAGRLDEFARRVIAGSDRRGSSARRS